MKASMDLDRKIENPALVAALERMAADPSDAAKDAVLAEIQQATYLVAVVGEEGAPPPAEGDGAALVEQELEILTAEQDDLHFLPLFTDWQAIADYTDMTIHGLVMPARDAWSFALEDGGYDGVVINPAGNALPLSKPLLEYLKSADPTLAN